MRYLFALLVISCLGCVLAQTPDNVKESFQKKYPNAEDVSWGLDRNALREAHFKMDGEKYRADFRLDGTWVETEQNVKWKDLPEAVQDAFEERFDEDDIEEIEKVDHHSKGVFYDIEFKEKGDKSDIEITPSGQVLGIY